ncbi:hypothetical protein ABK040_005847 [Willaertia magna]
MKLYIKIPGFTPIVLRLKESKLQIHHCIEVANEYYGKLFNGNPPVPLYIQKVINFNNGDKLLIFYREETSDFGFNMHIQHKISIYEEPPACPESVIFMKSPCPKLYRGILPKVVSLNRLLLILTDGTIDKFLIDVFWWRYRSFVKPSVLLRKLMERFDVPGIQRNESPRENSNTAGQYTFLDECYYHVEVKTMIQTTVGKMLYDWVKNYYFDFDDKMEKALTNFCNTRMIAAGLSCVSSKILNLMKTQSRLAPWQIELEKSKQGKSEKRHSLAYTNLSLLRMDPREFAETITLMDYNIYKDIHVTELLGFAWNKEKKRHMAPNLVKATSFFNRISNWIIFQLLNEYNNNVRKKMIEMLIKVVEYLKELNSFNMIMAVYSALENSNIDRLQDTWSIVDDKTKKQRTEWSKFCSTEGNSKNLREAMEKAYTEFSPCCPFIAIFLKDLVFVNDGNPSFIDGKINFHKYVVEYLVMLNILRFRDRPYENITLREDIKTVLETYQLKEEDELYSLSLKIQPRKK